jgi:hypothetical protein
MLGFAGLVFPHQKDLLIWTSSNSFQAQRLHIFFFNLIVGGTVILWFTNKESKFSKNTWIYLAISFIFSTSVFLNLYIISLISGIILVFLVERVRIHHFGFFPFSFLNYKVPVEKKFHLASLLCLSIGLILAELTILNNYYLKIIPSNFLPLNYFYLGFSFPLSLIIFSIIYDLMDRKEDPTLRLQKEASFWFVNIGVIIFFIFIILKMAIGEIFCASLLIIYILFTIYLFLKNTDYFINKKFLISGMFFLVLTSLTGLSMICLQFFYPGISKYQFLNNLLLQMHGYLALYGWSLSGLIVIIRNLDIHQKYQNNKKILLHWFLLIILVPIGILNLWFAILAVPIFLIYFWSALI